MKKIIIKKELNLTDQNCKLLKSSNSNAMQAGAIKLQKHKIAEKHYETTLNVKYLVFDPSKSDLKCIVSVHLTQKLEIDLLHDDEDKRGFFRPK